LRTEGEGHVAKIVRFEDVQAWQKARSLVRQLYEMTGNGVLAKDYGLRDQVRRAATSMMANIAEGFARRTSKEFLYFLNMAHGSAAELQSHLYVTADLGYISDTEREKLYREVEEVSKMVQGLMRYLRSTRNPQLTTRNSRRSS
jgi:four helix bundle protein